MIIQFLAGSLGFLVMALIYSVVTRRGCARETEESSELIRNLLVAIGRSDGDDWHHTYSTTGGLTRIAPMKYGGGETAGRWITAYRDGSVYLSMSDGKSCGHERLLITKEDKIKVRDAIGKMLLRQSSKALKNDFTISVLDEMAVAASD